MAEGNGHFLELRGVQKRFGDNLVLRGIDMDVGEHQVVSLIGGSGSGKSTLLRCINALEPVDAGTITVEGTLISGPGVDVDRHRRDVGIVFQAFNLFPHMSVLQNITLAPRQVLRLSKGEAEARADALLERVGLAAKRQDYPDSLSGGQQQRVAIVRALAMQPKLLLATHEMSFAREVSSTVCFLDEGLICEQGAPTQIFSEPTHPRTQAFLKRIIAAGRL